MMNWFCRLFGEAEGKTLPLSSGPGVLLLAVILNCGLSGAEHSAFAQEAGDLQETVQEAVSTRQDTQISQDVWAEQKADLTARYRAAQANVDWLLGRRSEEGEKVAALEGRIAEMGRRLTEAKRLESSIQDSLIVILVKLEETVRAGSPFLPEERALRLSSVRRDLVQPDVPSAEKLRRLLEALQVEAGYASTVEVYQDRIEIDGQDVHADILRLGRLSLFWRTPDGDRVGHYDRAADCWMELSGRHVRAITRAMEMATRMRPMELIDLPLGRIKP
ncbi:MAG: DUF3450 domain-containing protein [Gemmatimonadales bacterium]|nr:DUF3450 domain-containing protein [Gemmatimonadales bacterium]